MPYNNKVHIECFAKNMRFLQEYKVITDLSIRVKLTAPSMQKCHVLVDGKFVKNENGL